LLCGFVRVATCPPPPSRASSDISLSPSKPGPLCGPHDPHSGSITVAERCAAHKARILDLLLSDSSSPTAQTWGGLRSASPVPARPEAPVTDERSRAKVDEGRPVAPPELDRGRFETFVGRAAAAVPGIDSMLKRLNAGHDLRGDKGAVAAAGYVRPPGGRDRQRLNAGLVGPLPPPADGRLPGQLAPQLRHLPR